MGSVVHGPQITPITPERRQILMPKIVLDPGLSTIGLRKLTKLSSTLARLSKL